MADLVVQGMEWLGDSIYQRAVVRELVKDYDVYLETPWPQIVSDLPIKCVKTGRFRFQQKNTQGRIWYRAPACERRIVKYRSNPGKSMLLAMCESVGVRSAITFDLPAIDVVLEPYVLIRPASVRHGWKGDARSPKAEYLATAADKLRRHFRIISVADFGQSTGFGGPDRPLLPLPYADQQYHSGELSADELFALVAGAAAVVGGVGWLVPMAVAYRVPMLLIFGGCGLHNAPNRIFDPCMDTSRVEQLIPDELCMCGDHDHECNKTISNVEERIERWVFRLVAGCESAMVAGIGNRLVSGNCAAV